jgi:hypothetical protein
MAAKREKDPRHKYLPSRKGTCKRIFGAHICGLPWNDDVHDVHEILDDAMTEEEKRRNEREYGE